MLEEIQHLGGIEFARDHALGAVIKTHHAPAGAADVKDGHRHQRDVVRRPFVPVGFLVPAGFHQIEKIGMRQHRAFRLSRGAGGVELDRYVPLVDVDVRIVAALRVAPGRIVLPARRAAFGGDEAADTRELRLDGADLLDELRPDEQHRCLAVFDDEGDFRSGQSPVHRRHHHARLHRAHQQLEIDVAVLAEIGDALARTNAERLQAVGDAIGLDIKLGKAGLTAFEFKGDGIAAGLRPRAQHVCKVCRLLEVGHVAPRGPIFCVVATLVCHCEER